eukprot:370817-Amphidinium_carterae.1
MAKVEDRATKHEQHSYQLEQRLAHVTAMHSTTVSEVQAELEALQASTPKFKKIETPEFGVEAIGLGPQSDSAPMDTVKQIFPVPAGSCGDCGHANVGLLVCVQD